MKPANGLDMGNAIETENSRLTLRVYALNTAKMEFPFIKMEKATGEAGFWK